ncbi:MAG: hypothetical protein J5965_04010 [Aeriscardovia sp.]|nr:hypothetical protein [Aeriscardovia sp.]MBO6249208.1 hypothetical protein [Bacteroidales bacterium]
MDLYEALKAGTSAEELLKAFHKDLDEANARIAAEEEAAADKEYLADCRECLAEAIIEYAEAFLGEDLDESFSVESVIETLEGFEKEMEQAVAFSKKLDKMLEKAKNENKKPVGIKVTTRSIDDDDIIAQFLKSLK